MILDCVDWHEIDESSNATIGAVGKLYDLLYQVYCAKLTLAGSELAQEKQLRAFIKSSREERLKGT